MNKFQYFLKKHSPIILTSIGALGVVGTSVLAVKATPKALNLLEEVKKEKGGELTTLETIKVAWKPYIPAVITGTSTIICIFGANYLNTKIQASLISAYALLDNSYKEYRNKAKDVYGEDADNKIKAKIAEVNVDGIELENEKLMFFDFQSIRHYQSTIEHVMQAECEFLDLLRDKGFASLNDYYRILGIPPISHGDTLGWFDMEQIDPYGCEELEFIYEKSITKDGTTIYTVDTNVPPSSNFIL